MALRIIGREDEPQEQVPAPQATELLEERRKEAPAGLRPSVRDRCGSGGLSASVFGTQSSKQPDPRWPRAAALGYGGLAAVWIAVIDKPRSFLATRAQTSCGQVRGEDC